MRIGEGHTYIWKQCGSSQPNAGSGGGTLGGTQKEQKELHNFFFLPFFATYTKEAAEYSHHERNERLER